MNSSPVIQVRDLVFRRVPQPGQAAFEMRVDDFVVRAGDVVGIVGPSGCGKSTLLRRPTIVGELRLMDTNAATLWQRDDVEACTALRARHVGVVLQTGGLIPSLDVMDNVMLSQRLLGRPEIGHATELLQALGLASLSHRLPSQLSIGQRQRVAIARALAHRPSLVLADEPTASLGLDHAPAALDLLLRLGQDHGAALVIVSHDVRLLQDKSVPLRRCAVHDGVVRLEPA